MNRFIFILGIATLFSCQKEEAELPPPNILWINCEDIGPNLGCYGDDFATTPNIDRLASEGVVYERAYAAAPICSPSRSTIITGIPATSLGTQHLRSHINLPEFIKTLPEYLQQAGYFTTLFGKTDYNFNPDKPDERFDYLHWTSDLTPWKKRDDKPFFSYFVFGMTHEGSTQKSKIWKRNTKNLSPELFHNPEQVPVPVHHPKTAAMKNVWAHYYDNITVLDTTIGHIMHQLEKDGLKDDTFVFFFSDHGAGMPGHKRWLNTYGLNVPLVVYVPEKYKHLVPVSRGESSERLVTFSDLAPTVLELANTKIPSTMEGIPFMGNEELQSRNHIVATRSRADNMYETSRCIIDSQYIYVRNYRPHYPYMQSGHIFETKEKEAFREIIRLHEKDSLLPEFAKYFASKPVEELYDIQNDPYCQQNLVGITKYNKVKQSMKDNMHQWILETRDVGFLHEPEYMIRSEGSSPYEMAREKSNYHLEEILRAAEAVGKADIEDFIELSGSEDSGVRYWAVIGMQYLNDNKAIPALKELLADTSPAVQVEAAYTLAKMGQLNGSLEILDKYVQDERPWLALHAARSIELIGENAIPLVATLYQVKEKYAAPPDSKARFSDSDFAFFISMSVIYALENCGESFEHSLK